MKLYPIYDCKEDKVSAKEVSRKLHEAQEGLKDALNPKNRLNVDGLMKKIIWGRTIPSWEVTADMKQDAYEANSN